MKNKLYNLKKEINNYIINNNKDLELFKKKYLGKNGIINNYIKQISKINIQYEKKYIGIEINHIKKIVLIKIKNFRKNIINNENINNDFINEDLTNPIKVLPNIGSRHPIFIIKNNIINFFNKIGFILTNGIEIEDDWHNFTALNFSKDHPSRDMQDTFFIKGFKDNILRTHTSSVQIRYMKIYKPPIRIISFGKVYRREKISSRSHCMFHQIEGFYINKCVSFLDLKEIIQYFIKFFFGDYKLRLRPSYFPFTEPSLEIDIYWGLKNEKDYKITKGSGWVEIMGCGMIHPNVLKNVNIDTKIYSGFAFGIGIERIAMLLYKIEDIRFFYENDIRFLKQFKYEK